MDESRSGHPTRLPLIIERPDLAHPVRRAVGMLLTLLCWAVWLGMWLALLHAVRPDLGLELPRFLRLQGVSLESFSALARLLPYALASALAVLLAAYLLERFRGRAARPDLRWRPVGMERLARDAALEPGNLDRWQAAQVLYVEHGPLGRVKNASTRVPQASD